METQDDMCARTAKKILSRLAAKLDYVRESLTYKEIIILFEQYQENFKKHEYYIIVKDEKKYFNDEFNNLISQEFMNYDIDGQYQGLNYAFSLINQKDISNEYEREQLNNLYNRLFRRYTAKMDKIYDTRKQVMLNNEQLNKKIITDEESKEEFLDFLNKLTVQIDYSLEKIRRHIKLTEKE